MPRLLVLCLLRRRRRVTHFGRRVAYADVRRTPQPASSGDVAVGLLVIFMTFLTPCGYMLNDVHQLRRD